MYPKHRVPPRQRGRRAMSQPVRKAMAMILAPWILGRPAGVDLEPAFILVTVVLGIFLMYLFGRYWQQ